MKKGVLKISLIALVLTNINAASTSFPATNTTTDDLSSRISCELLTNSPHCVKLGKKFYLIHPEHLLNWFQADRYCRQQNGRLALIQNDEEFDAILAYISQKEFRDRGDFKYWLAASNLGSPNIWHEIESGKPLQYARWGVEFPDFRTGTNPENCLNLIWWSENKYVMNDEVCTNVLSFICELNIGDFNENDGQGMDTWQVATIKRNFQNSRLIILVN